MKKQNMDKLFKGKGFYISLLTGALAIFAIGVLSLNLFSNDSKEDLADLNEPSIDFANDLLPEVEEPDLETAKVEAEEYSLPQDTEEKIEEITQSLPEKKVVPEEVTPKVEAPVEEAKVSKKQPVREEVVPVMTAQGQISKLKFDEELGLLWPLNGDIIMNYSMSNTIYFQTLAQYKCNPAIIISAEVGSKVICAANAVVTDIVDNEETGLTVTTSIGNDYSVIYGQLADVKVEVGDSMKEGDLLGVIAEPTKYYVVEGSNLYLKVEQNDESVNPMLLLR